MNPEGGVFFFVSRVVAIEIILDLCRAGNLKIAPTLGIK